MKTILFYFNSMAPAGGIERVIATLANKFSETMDVTILVKDDCQSYYELNSKVKLISLGKAINLNMDSKISRFFEVGKSLFKSQKKLRLFLKNNSFDYYYIAHPLNVLEFHLAKRINKSVIITEHGGIDAYNSIYKKIKKWLYPKAKIYVIPTKTDTKLYEKLGFSTVYIPHFRSKLNYFQSDQKNNIALSIGRMTEAKRQWILIDLWNNIVYKYGITNWQLHIVGDGNLKEKYIERINALGLETYIKILLPKVNVEIYYKEASFFLLTSDSEGFGMVILEAMSFGLPCISYDCPSGPRDMINDGENGFLVPNNDFEALETATLKLIQNQSLLYLQGENAFKASKDWDDIYILEKWKEVLN
ncbi:glycosyltransferase family 4 protein [Elizabethkingia anophelis]|uniref:glycosyltransferase family 4 protein n=1 Tax=Elizabethkingia anophelis TaxID=1117645 RepID=UPI0021A81588|nr:glycosyltransferase family 4 protein [Elizabethkingia anophelis]MCT3977720.1 glycosyltransferase family 4 protein [Elizabethkingia anophelis]MCT4041335.1 glycosyltransferase family 4 protein [Elizabethkingia anophelis]MCT4174031.1 glycosyltransferase family 4 protein [Elizabethkingia anophelis]MCT4177712.1 glycosyltransferase family 4 protein [Elizabethkingia anophelis]